MIVLVTGGAGYIGSHFVLALLEAGHQPVVIDDLSTGNLKAVPAHIPFIQGDVGDKKLLVDVFRNYPVDAIVHFAGSIVVADSVTDPLSYYDNNSSTTRTLLEAAIKSGVDKLVFSSTAAVYGNAAMSEVAETSPLSPLSPYGRSKLVIEWMIEDCGNAYGLRYAILRYFNVAGADPYLRAGQSSKVSSHLIKIAVEAVTGRRAGVDVFGTDYPTTDGSCVRDYIHVSDLAAAHTAALQWLQDGGEKGIFNCGYGEGHSVLQVLEAVRRLSGVDFPIALKDRRPGDPAMIVADASRARALLHWRPKYNDLDAMIAHALAWEKALAAERGHAASD